MDPQPNNPGSPPYTEPHDWITGYLTVHSMSKPSYRVAFALWIIIASFFLIGTLVHLLGTSKPYWFAHWSKWALRRRTWRKNAGKKEAEKTGKPHRQPTPLPSNSQLLSLVFLFILSMILCFVGPDYLAPRRPPGIPDGPAPPSTLPPQKRAVNKEEIERYVAYYTISKSWWTVAGRTGNIAFALFPLCILFALKAAPFALFALPYTTQFSFDKLSTLHRWVGRLIYFITVIHVLAWSIQLATTKNPVTGRTTYIYAWLYPPFVWGWAAFAPFTVLIFSSSRFFRYNFYESFYALHVFLVPITLFTAGMHHPSVGWWCWSALVIWVAERAWRATWWVWVNGIFKRKMPNGPPRGEKAMHLSRQSSISTLGLKMGPAQLDTISEYTDYEAPLLSRKHSRVPTKVESLMSPPSTYVPPPGYGYAELMPGKTIRLTVLTPECRPWAPGQHFILSIPSINKFTSHPFTVGSICDQESSNPAGRVLIFFIRAKAGWTKTLWDTVVALGARDKPFCDGEEPPRGTFFPERGCILRTFVEGPFGSVARTDWIEYSSVLLVAGGSGVSFALSVLVYLCLCLSGRASKYLGGQSKPFSRVSRVRFVWLAREFSHISWCASIVRRCMALVPSSALQVDIFVTNVPKSMPPAGSGNDGSKPPRLSWTPAKNQVSLNPTGISSMEDVSLESHSRIPIQVVSPEEKSRRHASMTTFDDHNSLLMPNPHDGAPGRYGDGGLKGKDYDYEMGLGETSHFQEDSNYDVLDYTHFNGDLDAEVNPAEESFSRRLRQEGALRRKMTRKMTMGMGMEQPQQDQESLWADLGQQVASPTLIVTPGPGETFSPPPSSNTHDGEPSHSRTLPVTPGDESMGMEGRRSSVPPYMQKYADLEKTARSRDKRLERTSMSSLRDNIMDVSAIQDMLPKVGKGARGEEVALQFSDNELEDLLSMTEYAWPGRPMLDKLLKEEVNQAKGPLVVACCGPTQLSASIRKIVAAQIDPVKIKAGDSTGYISCVTEEFEY